MASLSATPDDLFAEYVGTGDLALRLWRGGLRITPSSLTFRLAPSHTVTGLARSLASGLSIEQGNGVTDLIAEAEAFLSDDARLRRATRPLADDSLPTSYGAPTSLVRSLLAVDALQEGILRSLIQRFSELGMQGGDNDLARAVLASLKWLDVLIDGRSLCELLISIMDIVTLALKREIVESLPEIIDDAARPLAVDSLVQVMRSDASLNDVIVDTLGALGVDDDAQVKDVNTTVLAALASSQPEILPVTVRYLIATCPTSLLAETVKGLRQNLAVASLGAVAGRLSLDALRSGFRMRKNVADAAIAALKAISEPGEHQPADVWIILALLDSPIHRKVAETLFRKKVAAGLLSHSLIEAAIAPFAAGLGDQTTRIIGLASICLKASTEPVARRVGVEMFTLSYRLFSSLSSSASRNVLVALLEHVGSRRVTEVDAALDAFVKIALVGEKTRALVPHSSTLRGLLDFLESFSDDQLRKIWTLFALLCRSSIGGRQQAGIEEDDDDDDDDDGDDDDSDEDSDVEAGAGKSRKRRTVATVSASDDPELSPFMILLRKELTHTDAMYRRIGVLGMCTFLKVLDASYSSELYDLLRASGTTSASSEGMAFDELARILPSGSRPHPKTLTFLRERISSSFEETFFGTASVPGDKVEDDDLKHELWYNLDGGTPEDCVPISRFFVGEKTLGPPEALQALAPQLRAVSVLTALSEGGSLSEIDGVVGAPLRLPLRANIVDFGGMSVNAQRIALASMFAGYAWLVELVNNFATQTEPELRAKCIQRMDNILEMRSLISDCVNVTPAWVEALEMFKPGSVVGGVVAVSTSATSKGSKGEQSAPNNQESSLWMPHVRVLSSDALALISVTTPVSWQQSETMMSQPQHQVSRLSVTCLEHLLAELGKQVVVGLQISSGGASSAGGLGRSVLGSSASTKPVKCTRTSGSTPMAPSAAVSALSHFERLRTPLIALGAQLSNCVSEYLADSTSEEDRSMHQACILLCLKCLAGTLSTGMFSNDPAARDLLFDILTGIKYQSSKQPPSASDPLVPKDIEVAAKYAFTQLKGIGKVVIAKAMESDGAVVSDEESDEEMATPQQTGPVGSVTSFEITSAILAVLDATFGHCSRLGNEKMSRQLSDSAGLLLERQWSEDALKARKSMAILPGVIRIFIQKSSDPTDSIHTAYVQLQAFIKRKKLAKERNYKRPVDATQAKESEDLGGDGLVLWGTLNLKTSRSFFVGLVEQILWTLKSAKTADDDESSANSFKRLMNLVDLSNQVLELVREEETFVGPTMRAGRNWVELFMRVCMPFMKGQMKEHRQKVLKVFKKLQKVIRLLQNVSSHGKAMRDNSLSGLIPPLRKTLEVWLYKTREFLSSGADDETNVAFRLGTLATRDIHGNKLKDNALVQEDPEVSEGEISESLDEDDDEEARGFKAGGGSDVEGDYGDKENNGRAVSMSLSLPRARVTSVDRAKAKKKRAKAAAQKQKAVASKNGKKRRSVTDDDMVLGGGRGGSGSASKRRKKDKKAARESQIIARKGDESEGERSEAEPEESLLVVDEGEAEEADEDVDEDDESVHSAHSLRLRSKMDKERKLFDTQASHSGSEDEGENGDGSPGSMDDFLDD